VRYGFFNEESVPDPGGYSHIFWHILDIIEGVRRGKMVVISKEEREIAVLLRIPSSAADISSKSRVCNPKPRLRTKARLVASKISERNARDWLADLGGAERKAHATTSCAQALSWTWWVWT
jgi:antitoxin (DNA-binding transcriptional repressor) of toxin-antitoxin stability system